MSFYFRKRIALIYDLGRGFIILQKEDLKFLDELKNSDLLNEQSIVNMLKEEINQNIKAMSELIDSLAINFPRAYKHALTLKSIRMLLSNERRTIKQMESNGVISEKDAEGLLEKVVVTTWFSKEGDVACGSWDLCRHKAGFEYVETLEETTAYSISVEQLDELYRSYIDLANWMRVLQQENFLRLQDIHIRRLNWSAQERYEHLTKECPELFQRVNLGYIASFLGITQQSLSRIRANRLFLT